MKGPSVKRLLRAPRAELSAVECETELPQGVGLPSGVKPLAHLRGVIERLRPSWGARPLLVLTHRTPDPDALGAMAGLRHLLERAFGLFPEIAAAGRIFRAENLAMVRELNLYFADAERLDPRRYAGILLVDTQPGFGHTELPEDLPVVAVFDHHRPPPEGRLERPLPPHYDVRLGVGASSAMIYGYLRDAGLELDEKTATALCCGVRFDTGDLARGTGLDSEAFYETFRRADRAKLARIQRPILPAAYYRDLYRSLSRARRYGSTVIGLLGRVANPESVAEMADFFLRMEGCRWSLVGGAFEHAYHVSMRTDGREAYPLMEHVLAGEGSFGGRSSVAGGQIKLASEDWREVQRLERRLRTRALELVDPAEKVGRRGLPLTQMP